MKKGMFGLCLLVLTGVAALRAQTPLRGEVRDAGGQPVAYASVVVRADSTETGAFKGYATTAEDGSFEVPGGASGGDYVHVRCLGFAPACLRVSDPTARLVVVLHELAEVLDEVTVKGRYSGVVQRGDTVRFDIGHFKTGTETTVADVLRRLPGVEVADNGKVSYGGKAVDRVLLDGKDMFGGSSGNLAVNNLSADLMTGAEMLTDYKEGSLADDYKRQRQLALNIKTSGGRRLTGNASAGGGYREKYEGKAVLIGIGEDFSANVLLSANNTGTPVFTMNDYLQNIYGMDNLLAQHTERQLDISSEEMAMMVPPADMYSRHNGTASANATYQPSDAFKLKTNVLYYGAKTDAESQSEYIYQWDNSRNSHNLHTDGRNHYLSVGVQESWRPGKRFELEAHTQWIYAAGTTWRQTRDEGISQVSAWTDDGNHRHALKQDLSANWRIGKGIGYANVDLDYARHLQDVLLRSDTMLLDMDYMQAVDGRYAYGAATCGQRIHWLSEAGYLYPLPGHVSLNTSLSYGYEKHVSDYEDSNRHRDALRLHEYALNLSLEKNKGLWQFAVGAALQRDRFRSAIAGLDHHSRWAVVPKASLTLEFSQSHRLTLRGEYDLRAQTDAARLSRHGRVLDYAAAQEASSVRNPFGRVGQAGFSYVFQRLTSATYYYLSGTYTHEANALKPYVRQQGLVTLTSYGNGGTSEEGQLVSTLMQGLGGWPLSLTLVAVYHYLRTPSWLNGIEQYNYARATSGNLTFKTRLKGWLNAEWGGRWQFARNHTEGSGVRNRQTEWGMTGKLTMALGSLSGYVRGGYSRVSSPLYGLSLVDIGLHAEYRLKTWSLFLHCDNLLNADALEWSSMIHTSVYTGNTTYRRMPGYALLGLAYRF